MLMQQPGISNHGVNHRTLRQRFWGIKTLMLGDAKLGTNLGVDHIYYVPRVGRWWHVAVPKLLRLSYCTQPISTLNPFCRLHRSIPILFSIHCISSVRSVYSSTHDLSPCFRRQSPKATDTGTLSVHSRCYRIQLSYWLAVFVNSEYISPKHLKLQKRGQWLQWWFGDSVPLSSL